MRLVRVCVISALGCPERAERERDPHCSERDDYEGKVLRRGKRSGYVGMASASLEEFLLFVFSALALLAQPRVRDRGGLGAMEVFECAARVACLP